MPTILVVDDVQTDRELIGKVVQSTGNHPEYASDGEEAIEKARTLKPALVLLDVVMPKQDGFATCRKLKKDPDTAKILYNLISGLMQQGINAVPDKQAQTILQSLKMSARESEIVWEADIPEKIVADFLKPKPAPPATTKPAPRPPAGQLCGEGASLRRRSL